MSRAYTTRDDFAKAVKDGVTPSDSTILRKQFIANSIKAVDTKETRTRQFVISTGAVDRDNDAIDGKGWKLDNYKKNPVVLFAHDYSSLPIGKCIDIKMSGGTLMATAEFADHDMASTVLRLIDGGFLNATSVGFRPLKFQPNAQRRGIDFEEQELLEFSVVPVPANPEALIVARELVGDVALVKDWATKTLAALTVEEKKADPPPPPAPEAGKKPPVAPDAADAEADDEADDSEDAEAAEAEADGKKKPPMPFPPKAAEDIAQRVLRALKGGCNCMTKSDHDAMTCSCCKGGKCGGSCCEQATDSAVAKRGRVLSGKNEAKIRAAQGHLDDVIKSLPDMADGDADVEEMAIDLVETKDAEVVLDMGGDDSLDIDSVELKAALATAFGDSMRASLAEIIKTTTQSTISRMRGRLD